MEKMMRGCIRLLFGIIFAFLFTFPQASNADSIQEVTIYNSSNQLQTIARNIGSFNNGVMLVVRNDAVHDLIWTDGVSQIPILRGTTADVTYENGIQVGNKFFFSAFTESHGTELYVTSGGAFDSTIVKDLLPGLGSSEPSGFIALGNFACFRFYTSSSVVLGCSDGTSPGTNALLNLTSNEYDPKISATLNGKLIIMGSDPIKGDEPFITDGTLAGTSLLSDLAAGSAHYYSKWYNFTTLNGKVYFSYLISSGKSEIWSTDGSQAGTIRILTNPQIFDLRFITELIPFEGKLIIAGHTPDLDDGRILVTDGTVGGAVTEIFRAGVVPDTKWIKGTREIGDKVRIPLEYPNGSLIGIVECTSSACSVDSDLNFSQAVDSGRKLGDFWYFDLESLDIGSEIAQVKASAPHIFNYISDIIFGFMDPSYDFENSVIINNKLFVTGININRGTALQILSQGPDNCPSDIFKHNPGICGCGVGEDDGDSDQDLIIDCIDTCIFGEGSGCPVITPTPLPLPESTPSGSKTQPEKPQVKVVKGRVLVNPWHYDQDANYYFSVTIQEPKKKAKKRIIHVTKFNQQVAKNLPKGTTVSVQYYYVLVTSPSTYTSPWSKIKKIRIK